MTVGVGEFELDTLLNESKLQIEKILFKNWIHY